jgi:hypothetical protein
LTQAAGFEMPGEETRTQAAGKGPQTRRRGVKNTSGVGVEVIGNTREKRPCPKKVRKKENKGNVEERGQGGRSNRRVR